MQKITDATTLQCNKGTVSTPLTVTSRQDFCYIGNKKVATKQDKQAGVNIKPFGDCKLKPKTGGYLPCIPILAVWQNTTTQDEINSNKILLDISTC